MNNLYPIWAHGHGGWKFSEDCGLWYCQEWNQPPKEYCLGDRYIHCGDGRDSYGIIWYGSTSDNWHGNHFGCDLGAAIRWVQASAAKKLECKLWSKYNEKDSGTHYLRLEEE